MRRQHPHRVDPGDWTPETVADALRAAGCRVTGPRVAVLRALLDTGGTVDAATLAERAREHEPDVHDATVYRTVRVLTEVGIATHVHAGHGPSLVRLAGDDGLVAVCRGCGDIEPVPTDLIATMSTRMRARTGFALEPGHFALEGLCASCREPTDPSRPSPVGDGSPHRRDDLRRR
ncbi:Fur family transcriptional regulator [Ilumatobacter sp.]|uniref:Fur family transcriptional regulator n=1 Tax=Ilumatobacter sp. TaxID=1967498 RepID=UPI003B517345